MRAQERDDVDRDAERDRENYARDDSRGVDVADRDFGEHGVDDHQHGRRDQHAEHRGARHDADREPRVISAFQHLGHGELREHDNRRHGDAGDRRKDRVANHGRMAKTTRHVLQEFVRYAIGVRTDAGHHHEEAHEHEERHGAELVFGDRVGRREADQLARDAGIFLQDPDAEKSDGKKCRRNVHAGVDQQTEHKKSRQADLRVSHDITFVAGSISIRRWLRRPARTNCTESTKYWIAMTAEPSVMTANTGHFGNVKTPMLP